ncbi:transporter [Pandoraea horticolens]|uniref:Transporter n=1 Tax=Pandoraea horticolens TaxID=2508298 RepID=A0A5E4YVF9_9BURK|nr:transporter [Pandoraea horticolens]VVE52944.1 transporter [Pandoraea horticolens]
MKKQLMYLALFCPLSAFAAHPLVTDDTGTQGDGNWQFETNSEVTSKQPDIGHQSLWNSTLTRGVGEAIDLYVNVPYTTIQNRSDTAGSGIGDVETGAKWRMYDNGAFSIGLKPYLTFPSGSDRRGLGTGRVNAGATLLTQYAIGDWTFLFNAGATYEPNRQSQRQALWKVSGAVMYRVLPSTQLIFDVGTSQNPDFAQRTNPAFMILGAIYSPKPWLDLDVGYRRGLNPQTYSDSWMGGMTVRW